MSLRFSTIDSSVFRAIPAAFLVVSALSGSFASADPSARPQDIAVRDAAVDQVLLLNAVRGAEAAQHAVTMKGSESCASAAITSSPSATIPEHTAIIYPAKGSNPELNFLDGSERGEGTYAYQVSYEQPLKEKSLAVGLTYLNEGHIAKNHRDDYAAQLWSKWDLFGGRLRLGAGAGPDLYYDTDADDNSTGYKDSHGVGLMASVVAELKLGYGFSLEGRLNKLAFSNSYGASSGLLGIKYELPVSAYDRSLASFFASHSGSSSNEGEGKPRKYDIAVGGGESIVNNFHSETGRAMDIAVSRDLRGPFEATVSFLNEGDTKVLSRMGIATQIGLKHTFGNGFVTLHADAGPYFDHVSKLLPGAGDGSKPSPVVALFTYGARFRISKNTGIGVSFNRVTTRNSTDSDVLMVQGDWKF